MSNRVIWCIGLYASASTWMFNAVRLLYGVARPPLAVRTHFVSGRFDSAAFAEPVTHIVKSHEVGAAVEVELDYCAGRMIVTIRDPRDAVSSLMLYHHHDFERALDHVKEAMRLCMRFAGDPRALTYHYESRFFENPAVLAAIAAHLGIGMLPEAGATVFEALKRAEVEKHIAAMDHLPGILQDRASGDRLDPHTHWHTHHAGRSGEIGRWRRELTGMQAKAVEERLRDCYRFDDRVI